MQNREHLIDQHIREYESRQKHVDELIQRAHEHAEGQPDAKQDLDKLVGKHGKLVSGLEDLKQGKVDPHAVEAIEEAGPMGVWFGLVSELETFIEGVEKK